MTSELSTESVLPFLTPFLKRPMLVAFSGGVDSTVLLHLLSRLRDEGLIASLSAIHVHHGLSDNADAWAGFCQAFCEQRQIACIVERVELAGGASLEDQARKARYSAFEKHLPKGGCLVLGHHLDDQAETLLFRLFRGSGLDGLAGMPERRALGQGELLRPLLKVPRQGIEAYAVQHGLSHIEDESNSDDRFARNYLRNSLIPEIESRWPGASKRLGALAEEAGAINGFVDERVEAYAESIIVSPPSKFWGVSAVLDLSRLSELQSSWQSRVARYWLAEQAGEVLGRDRLKALFSEVIEAQADAEPEFQLSGGIVKRYRGYLAFVARESELPAEVEWPWSNQPVLDLPLGKLGVSDAAGSFQGFYLPSEPLIVRYRHHLPEGMKVRVAGRKGSKTVKRWLQEFRVPPWVRSHVPFLFFGEDMLGVPGLWVCEGWQGNSGNDRQVNWQL